jgi:hypothetical protein
MAKSSAGGKAGLWSARVYIESTTTVVTVISKYQDSVTFSVFSLRFAADSVL